MAEEDTFAVSVLETVLKQLSSWPAPSQEGNRILVPTQCLYGGGSIIRVAVEGGPLTFVVHDDGGAIDEFSNHGAVHPRASGALRTHFRDQGILVGRNGEITSPEVGLQELAPTIALIANASREAEDLLLSRWKPRFRRNFKRQLRNLLEAEFPNAIKPEFRVAGSSQKQHVFDFALERTQGRLVLVDAVHNDQNAISSTVLRNLDVRDASRQGIEQRIVYDDAEEWSATDLNLLKLGGKVIPFSRAPAALHRLAA